MTEVLRADVLVVGGGVAGYLAAHSALNEGVSVALVCGTSGASNWIGSINAALGTDPEDTPQRLFDEMLAAGAQLNNALLVRTVVDRIGPEIERLADAGVPFERRGDGFARRRTVGSSRAWAVYSAGTVGVDLLRLLRGNEDERSGSALTQLRDSMLLGLHMQDGRVVGGLACCGDGHLVAIEARTTVLATGGAGALFSHTTNPRGSTGLGYMLALEVGAELVDLEFVAHEPLVTEGDNTCFSLPTTLLNEGARVLNGGGEDLIDSAGPPMSKDELCRRMVREAADGCGTAAGTLVLDVSAVGEDAIRRYPKVRRAIRLYDGTRIPVMPAQHFITGGVRTDEGGMSAVEGLFAVGEAAGGVHGAHRLAGCGSAEAIARGSLVGVRAADYARDATPVGAGRSPRVDPTVALALIPALDDPGLVCVRSETDAALGVLRSGERLEGCVARLTEIEGETTEIEGARNYVARSARLALAFAHSALQRQESRGDHFRTDFPDRDDERFLGNIAVRLGDSGAGIATRLIPTGDAAGRLTQALRSGDG